MLKCKQIIEMPCNTLTYISLLNAYKFYITNGEIYSMMMMSLIVSHHATNKNNNANISCIFLPIPKSTNNNNHYTKCNNNTRGKAIPLVSFFDNSHHTNKQHSFMLVNIDEPIFIRYIANGLEKRDLTNLVMWVKLTAGICLFSCSVYIPEDMISAWAV
jgi:hypothetical protein